MSKKRFKAKEVEEAITAAQGYASRAAEMLGCTPQTVYNYIAKYETVKAAHIAVREKRHDYVESKLMESIGEGNIASIIFYLKCQAKDRGYVEKQEIEHSGDVSVNVRELSDDELRTIAES